MNNSFDVEFIAENSSFQSEFSNVQVIGGGTIIIDDKMSNTSTNPVQNKVAKAYVDAIANQAVQLMDSKDQALAREIEQFLATNVVLKEEGKGLSTNDFTDEYKTKLDNLEEYVDNLVGDIEAVLDNIISAQENLIGGAE